MSNLSIATLMSDLCSDSNNCGVVPIVDCFRQLGKSTNQSFVGTSMKNSDRKSPVEIVVSRLTDITTLKCVDFFDSLWKNTKAFLTTENDNWRDRCVTK